MIRVIGPKDIKDINEYVINTTSRSNNWSRELSPFFLGPINLYDNYVSKNMENAWQFSKVYLCHVDEENNPTKDYFDWAIKGWDSKFAYRYPFGKNVKPLFSYWNGIKLTYLEARRKIYAPLYAKAVNKTTAFQKLKDISKTMDITLWDFDGYDYKAMGMTLKDVINNPDKKCGHGFILAMMLENELYNCLQS